MTRASLRFVPGLSLALAQALALSQGGCATAPKPAALAAYEELQRDPAMDETRKHFPELVASAEQYGQKADKDWQSNNIDESTREASMAEIKIRTALSRYQQERAKGRIQRLVAEQARADETLTSVDKDLASLNEQLKLMQKTARLSEQMASEQQRAEAERQKLSQQLETEQKRAAAQLALRTADTVEASKYAAADYGAATSMLAKADAEMKQANWGAAMASLEIARVKADKATELARPSYERAREVTQGKARAESLARDAASLPGFSRARR